MTMVCKEWLLLELLKTFKAETICVISGKNKTNEGWLHPPFHSIHSINSVISCHVIHSYLMICFGLICVNAVCYMVYITELIGITLPNVAHRPSLKLVHQA